MEKGRERGREGEGKGSRETSIMIDHIHHR